MSTYHDDILATLASQNLACTASQQVDAINSGLASQLAKQTLDARQFRGSFNAAQESFLAESERRAMDVSEALTASARTGQYLESAVMPGLSESLAILSHSEWIHEEMSRQTSVAEQMQAQLADALSQDHAIREMTEQFESVLPGYTAYLARVEQDVDSARALLGSDAYTAFENDFAQLKRAAVALDPLQHLSNALASSFGSTITAEALQNQLHQHQWEDISSDWMREYRSFAGLVADAMGHEFEGEDENDGDADAPAAIDDAPSVQRVALETSTDEVRQVALAYAMPFFEIDVRLKQLASRIDPMAIGGAISWERMILAIAHACPRHAPQLMRLAYPFLQCLSWHSAPGGACANGATELLSLDDAREFEVLARAMVCALKAVEQSLLD